MRPVKIEYGWNLLLKHSFMICRYTTKSFIEIPPCTKKVIFITKFVFSDLNPHFYEVNQEVWKRPYPWRNFKNIFSRPLFTIILRPEMLKFHPYSIWPGTQYGRIHHILCVKMMGSAWISIKLNVYDALLAMVISELKTDSVSIYLQYSVHRK